MVLYRIIKIIINNTNNELEYWRELLAKNKLKINMTKMEFIDIMFESDVEGNQKRFVI